MGGGFGECSKIALFKTVREIALFKTVREIALFKTVGEIALFKTVSEISMYAASPTTTSRKSNCLKVPLK